jgi:hypothetical protein
MVPEAQAVLGSTAVQPSFSGVNPGAHALAGMPAS